MANRLREWRLARGVTLERLAAAVGTDKTQISRLETGQRRLTLEWMERIARALKCRPADLMGDPPPASGPPPRRGRPPLTPKPLPIGALPAHGSVAAPPLVDFAGQKFAAIPMFDVRAAAGAGAEPEHEDILHHLLFRAEWVSSVTTAPLDQLAVIEVDGDSMEPTLRSGDTALVDRSQTSPGRKDGLYVLRREGGLQVKRVTLSWKSGLATIRSDNPSYATETGIDPATLDVRGRVLWIGRRV